MCLISNRLILYQTIEIFETLLFTEGTIIHQNEKKNLIILYPYGLINRFALILMILTF